MLVRLLALGLTVALLGVGAAALLASRHPSLPATAPPDRASLDPDLVARGAVLSAIGNCASCHTRPGGPAYAGGRAMPTPFGTVHATNITPDPVHGIGAWSEAAFVRAMRQGIDRDGRHLYPVFPYDQFTLITDADLAALYAYLMSLPPAPDATPPNAMRFPFGIRLLLEGWNLLHHRDVRFEPDLARSPEWNRGAYLVEGLGHCAACHTPRTLTGARDPARPMAGAMLGDGWYAPPVGALSVGKIAWTEDALVNYLLDGWDADHGVAAGPMTSVVNNLVLIDEDDAYAMAVYLLADGGGGDTGPAQTSREAARAREVSGQAPSDAERRPHAHDPRLVAGLETFAARCANCHRQGADTVPLALTAALRADNPANILAVVRLGIQPPQGSPTRTMPAFPGLTDVELHDLLRFMRVHFTDLPPWTGIDGAIRAAPRG